MILIYCRVSTEDQSRPEATSLDEQERKCRAVATLRGAGQFDVQNYVDAGVSGAIPLDERPAGHDLLQAAKKGDTIVATKLDRMFRSARDALNTAEDFRERGIDLVLIDMGTDPVTGKGVAKMFFGLLALVAEFERERIAERMDDGRKAKRALGGYTGGEIPYGYRVEGIGKLATLVPDREEQDVIQLICRMRRSRDNRWNQPGAIGRLLAKDGIVSRSGKRFQSIQIVRILKMAGYYGRSGYGGQVLQSGGEGGERQDQPEPPESGVPALCVGLSCRPDHVRGVVSVGQQQL